MAFIKKFYGVIILLLATLIFVVFQYYQSNQLEKLYQNPQSMDIYIFKGEQKYSPIQLDFVQKDSLYFFSHPFEFSNSIPSKAQILEDSFNNKIHYIYGRSELDRLVKDKVIVKIYR